MIKRIVTGFLLAGGMLLIAAQAAASPHVHQGANPFQESKHEHKLHCPLNEHHLDGPCPHYNGVHGSKHSESGISRECGGLPQGTVVTSLSFSPLDRTGLLVDTFFACGVPLTPEILSIYFMPFPGTLDPPPRSS